MDHQIVVDVDLDGLQEFDEVYKSKLNKLEGLIANTVERAGHIFIQEWIKTAETKFKHTDGGYAQGIQNGAKYPYSNDPLHFRIEHQSPHAYWLENGYDSFDMKKMLESSIKVRINKNGKRYLIIPFRHGNPDSTTFKAMPEEIYEKAKTLKQSKIIGTYKEGVVQGAKSFGEAETMRVNNPDRIKRNLYRWGGKLETGGDTYKIYDGMVRFDSNPNTARGILAKVTSKFIHNSNNNKPYSTYLTFRVMSEDSTGWIHPAQKPMNILGETMQRVEGQIRQFIDSGIQQGIEELFRNG